MDYETLGHMMKKLLLLRENPPKQAEWEILRKLAAGTEEKKYERPILRFHPGGIGVPA